MPNPEGISPFPYDEIDKDLGEAAKADARDAAFNMAAEFASVYLRWLILGPEGKSVRHRGTAQQIAAAIAKRAIVSAWVINPTLLRGQSLRAIAKGYGMSRTHLSEMAVAFGDQFGVHGRGQMPVYVRKGYSKRPQSVAKLYRTKIMSAPAGAGGQKPTSKK